MRWVSKLPLLHWAVSTVAPNVELTVEKETPEEKALKIEILKQELEQAHLKTKHDIIDLAVALQELRTLELEEGYEDVQLRVVRLSGPVDDENVSKARDQLYALAAAGAPGEPLVLDINSPGGSFDAGMELFGVMRELSKDGHRITTRISGMAGSMAGVISQAGDVRQIREGSYLHIHEASWGSIGKASEMMDAAKFIERLSKDIAKIYAKRSTMSVDEIYENMARKEWFLNADEALALGFIDAIV